MICNPALALLTVLILLALPNVLSEKPLSSRIKSQVRREFRKLLGLRGGFSLVAPSSDNDNNNTTEPEEISYLVIGGFPTSSSFNGEYIQSEKKVNNRLHYYRFLPNKSSVNHIFWSGSQWVLVQQSYIKSYSESSFKPENYLDSILAYSNSNHADIAMTSNSWYLNISRKLESLPVLSIFTCRKRNEDHHDDCDLPRKTPSYEFLDSVTKEREILGIPKKLLPYYLAFALDAIAVGLVMPLLPFTVMELGANAFQLSLVVSSNYMAQSIGVTIMGRVSDLYGRKIVMTLCLLASTLSYVFLSQAESLIGFALARIVSGSFGGLIPIIQSAVADSTSQADRPKYLGRIMATFGLGFVLGPGISAILTGWTTRQKIRLAGALPFLGFLTIFLIAKETKKNIRNLDLGIPFLSDSLPPPAPPSNNSTTTVSSPVGRKWRSSASSSFSTPTHSATKNNSNNNLGNSAAVSISIASSHKVAPTIASRAISPTPTKTLPSSSSVATNNLSSVATKEFAPTPFEIYLLVLNGFAIMFAFATETIYAMFIKDSFGYGESTLSTIFAVNGLFIGLFQVFLIKPVISMIGKHGTLAIGNILLAIGMVGVALVREAKPLHFAFFAAHIVGYSIADTTLASLISKYSSPGTQGRDLALNQAAQACARVVSPVIAGMLYEYSKRPHAWLPLGALPFLVGAMCPLIALAIPTYLYLQKRARKRRQLSLFTETSSVTAAAAPVVSTMKDRGWRSITYNWFQRRNSGERPIVDANNIEDMDEYAFAISSESNSDTEGVISNFH